MKPLKRMRRDELIEVIYRLMQSEEKLRTENEELKRRLREQEMNIENSGSIAEAALKLSGIFDSAQRAGEIFVKQYRAQAERMLERARREAGALGAAAREGAQATAEGTEHEDEAEQKSGEGDPPGTGHGAHPVEG
ncbi:MAG: hypothetical protein IKG85_07030 [Clostridia bacterium]|nr:hypothetical protein [Clostridia bacterium]